ncbi:MAG: acetyltransferase [Bryobacteraceae bacterium]
MIRIEVLTTRDQYDGAVDLQRKIWGFSDLELLPRRLFVVATKVGGHSLGAYDGDRMVGFLLAIPGLRHEGANPPMSYLHSHMLGVLPEYANRGLGRTMKLRQREIALETGVILVEWTFDPLELKNAYFNIERLGAIIRRYVPNQYGVSSSHLHGGLPTDRLVAEWWIAAGRTKDIIEGRGNPSTVVEGRLTVPADIGEMRSQDVKQAREIQQALERGFREYFDSGLAVIGFQRTSEAGTYLFGKY